MSTENSSWNSHIGNSLSVTPNHISLCKWHRYFEPPHNSLYTNTDIYQCHHHTPSWNLSSQTWHEWYLAWVTCIQRCRISRRTYIPQSRTPLLLSSRSPPFLSSWWKLKKGKWNNQNQSFGLLHRINFCLHQIAFAVLESNIWSLVNIGRFLSENGCIRHLKCGYF